MVKKRDDGGGLWNFARRFLASAAVTAAVVSLLKNVSTAPASFDKASAPLRSLPTLPPMIGPPQGRILKHSNGLCVKFSDGLLLADCGVLEGVVYLFHRDEFVELRLGEQCATAQALQPCAPSATFRRVAVGTDLFFLQADSKCLAPAAKPRDGTRLELGPCKGDDRQFQTSEAVSKVEPPSVETVVEVQKDEAEAEAEDVLVHVSGLCVRAQDEATGEDSTVLVLADCEEEPAKNVRFASFGRNFRFQIGRQCGHPEDSDASAEPRLAFPADCGSTKHFFQFQKLSEDLRLPGFVIQSVDSPTQYCIHPFGGSDQPPIGTELINHKQCDLGRKALRFRAGNVAKLAKEEPRLKRNMGNPLIPVPQEEPCSYYDEGKSQSSRPGKPCLPPPPFWPYKGLTEWKAQLGSRALAAVTPLEEVTEQRCHGWYLLGDQTWCNKAFDGSHGYGTIGLSFGIEERDMWSELVTQKFHIPVLLFDCFIPPERSPPISGTAPNNSECPKNALGEPKLGEICYGASYQSFRLCLAGQEVVAGGRKYGTLEAQLRGRAKLSVHLKIDVEGSEWDVLEWLVANPEEWDKVRTLDMEIHFGFGSAAGLEKYKDLDERAQLEREVKIMEALRERFYCTGSTLEVYRQGWAPEDNCGVEPCAEPPIYLPNSFSVTAFAVSYVHRELVD